MKSCEAFVRQGGLDPSPSPVNIIKAGYQELTEQKAPCFGNYYILPNCHLNLLLKAN